MVVNDRGRRGRPSRRPPGRAPPDAGAIQGASGEKRQEEENPALKALASMETTHKSMVSHYFPPIHPSIRRAAIPVHEKLTHTHTHTRSWFCGKGNHRQHASVERLR